MSKTKPVVLNGWVFRWQDEHQFTLEKKGPRDLPATLVIGEEAIPKSEVEKIIRAANDVITRWDSPLWKMQQHTGEFIHALRTAIEQFKSNTQQTEQ